MRRLSGILLLCVLGCSSGGTAPPPLYPVTGNLKVDGKPLADIIVQLMPVDMNSKAQPCSGTTDKDGNFKLATNGDRGATAGSFKVVLGTGIAQQQGPITVEEATKLSGEGRKFGGMPKQTYPFPKEWTNPKTSPKTIEIVDKGITLNLDL
jgi:hypothetical protein